MAQPKPEDLTPDEIATGVADGGYLLPKRISLPSHSVGAATERLESINGMGVTIHDDPALKGKPGQSRGNQLKAERMERQKLTLQLASQKASYLALRELAHRMGPGQVEEEETRDVVQVARLGLPKDGGGDVSVNVGVQSMVFKVVRE